MQAKEKKIGQGVLMKSLKGAHSRWSFKENCNESKCCRTTKKRVHSSKARDGPRHDSKQPQAPRRGGKSVKGLKNKSRWGLLGFCLVFQEEMMVQENPIELEKTMA